MAVFIEYEKLGFMFFDFGLSMGYSFGFGAKKLTSAAICPTDIPSLAVWYNKSAVRALSNSINIFFNLLIGLSRFG